MAQARKLPMSSPAEEADPPEIGPSQMPQVVRFHRKVSGLSQIELARLAGVGKTVIFDIEKGKRTVQLDTLLKVFSVLNIRTLFQSPLMETYIRNLNEKSQRIRSR